MHHKTPILVRNHRVHQMNRPIVRGGSLLTPKHMGKRLAAPGTMMNGPQTAPDMSRSTVPRFHIPTPRHAKRQNIRFG